MATAAGVSPATVERALNCRNGEGATTVEKVEQGGDRLGYRRDAAAATLATRREGHLACVIPTGVNLFLSALADGAPFDAGQERIRIDMHLRDNAP